MNTETMIQELTHVAYKHRNDKKFIGQLIISDMRNDVIKNWKCLWNMKQSVRPRNAERRWRSRGRRNRLESRGR